MCQHMVACFQGTLHECTPGKVLTELFVFLSINKIKKDDIPSIRASLNEVLINFPLMPSPTPLPSDWALTFHRNLLCSALINFMSLHGEQEGKMHQYFCANKYKSWRGGGSKPDASRPSSLPPAPLWGNVSFRDNYTAVSHTLRHTTTVLAPT